MGAFCPWGHFVRGRFVLGTFCLGDNLSWGQSVKGTFCLGTLCPQGHFLHGVILYMGTFCPVTVFAYEVLVQNCKVAKQSYKTIT